MSPATESDALQTTLERLRSDTGTSADIASLADALKLKSIKVQGSRSVGIGSAQDSVIITGDHNTYRNISVTFQGPQAGAIRMAIGKAQLQLIEEGDLTAATEIVSSEDGVLPYPPGALKKAVWATVAVVVGMLVIIICSILYGLDASLFGDVLIGVFVLKIVLDRPGFREIKEYETMPAKRFPCQVIEKTRNNEETFFLTVESTDRTRQRVVASNEQSEKIAVGDVGIIALKVNILQSFARIDI